MMSPYGSPGRSSPWRALTWSAFAGLLLAVLGLVVGWRLGRFGTQPDDLALDTRPVLLAMQKIGELHTASYVMNEVLRKETAQEPPDGLSLVPGVSNVVHWATHNQALVVAQGNVEAGVNLAALNAADVTRETLPDGTTHLHVHLPPVTVYPPNVQVQVQDSSTGLLWRDENIVPKAEAEARRRFQDAAEKAHIRSKAEANATDVLKRMMCAFGHNNVEFSFR